jgi:hypothetical protein
MNYNIDKSGEGTFASFKRGGVGQSKFLQLLQSQYEFTPQQM